MTSAWQITKRIFSDKRFSFLVIALAILARVVQLIFFYNIRVDGMYQVLAMQNFAEGHGFSSSYVLPADLSTVIYEPQINWPPGYSLLLYPFYILFNHNYIWAGITMDIIGAILLIIYSRKLLVLLNTPLQYINLFTLATAFFIYSFYFICSSDAIAITFFIMALYYSLLLIDGCGFSPKLILLTGLLLFLCGLIKYLFIPAAFVVPVFIFLKGKGDKSSGLVASGAVIFTVLFLSLGGYLLWQKLNSGSAAFISSTVRGFFPGNLAHAYPAASAAIINPETISLGFKEGSNAYYILFRILQVIHLLALLTTAFYVTKRLIKQGWRNIDTRNSFLYLSFFLSAAIMLLLTYLSITVGKEENIPGHWWSYVEEPRYYGLIVVLIHLNIFLLRSMIKWRGIKLKYVFLILLICLLPEIFRGVLFASRRILNAGKEEYSWQYEKEVQDYADELIQKKKKQYGDEMPVITGSSYYMYYRIGMYSHLPVMNDTSAINNPDKFNAKKPAMLFVVTSADDPVYEPENRYDLPIPLFPGLYKQELAGTFAGYNFYIIHVKPH